MSLSSVVSLGALRIQAQQRADLENSQNVSTPEWNQYISQSYKQLYDLLVSAYGNDYFVQTPFQFSVSSTQLYNLPTDFYKLLGVDLQYSASPNGWVTLKRFEFIERNKYSWLTPSPITTGLVQLWYIPEPTSLQFLPICATTLNSATISVPSGVSVLAVGMSVFGPGIQNNATILSINSNANTIVISSNALITQPVATLQFWIDSATMDGIAGWEEYVIIDAAIKARIKQEQDVSDLRISKQELHERITALSEGRDAGQAHHVSDVMAVNTPVLSIGAASLRYRLLGSQIQFVPCTTDDNVDSHAGAYGF